jgi:hypothetical protein
MNAPLDHAGLEAPQFAAALERANIWRGECIQQFAEIERSIGDALQLLSDAKPALKIKSGGQIRQSFEELKRVSGAKGSKVQFVAKSLDEIDRLIEWRAHLTHGVLSVWRGKAGRWLLTLEHRDSAGREPVRIHAIPRREADAMLDRLASEVETLQKRVLSMRHVLSTKGA